MKDWKLGEIPVGKGTWTTEFEYDEEGKVQRARFVLYNPAKNMRREVELGWVDDQHGNAYDAICYWESGGGGTVTIPWTIVNNVLYIGTVTQFRVHAGGDVDNAPRGYMKIGTTDRTQNATEELAEEVGPNVAEINPPTQLEGDPVNMNTAVFWTPGKDEGNSFHSVEVDPNYLVDDGNDSMRFVDGLVAPEGGESITRCQFDPWHVAVRKQDGLTIVGIARLMAQLEDEGRLFISHT